MAIEVKKEVTHHYYYNLDNKDKYTRYLEDVIKAKTILGEEYINIWRPDYTKYGRIDYKAISKELIGNGNGSGNDEML